MFEKKMAGAEIVEHRPNCVMHRRGKERPVTFPVHVNQYREPVCKEARRSVEQMGKHREAVQTEFCRICLGIKGMGIAVADSVEWGAHPSSWEPVAQVRSA